VENHIEGCNARDLAVSATTVAAVPR